MTLVDLAQTGTVLRGEWGAKDLPRVADWVQDTPWVLRYRVQGGLDARKQMLLELSVEGEVHLVCQRCLNRMPWPVDIHTQVFLFEKQSLLDMAEAENPDIDAVLLDEELTLPQLLEDEVLLSLPYAPVHPDCELPGPKEVQGKLNPFLVLAPLKEQLTKK